MAKAISYGKGRTIQVLALNDSTTELKIDNEVVRAGASGWQNLNIDSGGSTDNDVVPVVTEPGSTAQATDMRTPATLDDDSFKTKRAQRRSTRISKEALTQISAELQSGDKQLHNTIRRNSFMSTVVLKLDGSLQSLSGEGGGSGYAPIYANVGWEGKAIVARFKIGEGNQQRDIVMIRAMDNKTRTMHVKVLCGDFYAAREFREVDDNGDLVFDSWRIPDVW